MNSKSDMHTYSNNGARMTSLPDYGSLSLSYRQWGNAFHSLNLCGILAYASLMANHHQYVDSSWLEYGFCEPLHLEPKYWTTHDQSAYIMISIALSGLLLRHFNHHHSRNGSENNESTTSTSLADQLFVRASIGALGHASGHLLISHGHRHGYYPQPHETFWTSTQDNSLWIKLSYAVPGYLFFWIPLIQTYMMHSSRRWVVILAAIAQLVVLHIPVRFGFAYTQIVLFAGMSIDQLLHSLSVSNHHHYADETWDYALWPILTVIPSTIMSLVECMGCTTTNFMGMKTYGHVVYDTVMASSYVFYYYTTCCRKTKVAKPIKSL
jgi:hypothetical protein